MQVQDFLVKNIRSEDVIIALKIRAFREALHKRKHKRRKDIPLVAIPCS